MTRQGDITRILRYFTLLRKVQYDKKKVSMTKFIAQRVLGMTRQVSMTKFKICGLPRKFLKNLQILSLKAFKFNFFRKKPQGKFTQKFTC